MTNGGSTRGHAALYMAPTIVQSVIPLLTLPIFTRILSREEYGLWGIATAFGAMASGTAGLGLHSGFERSYFAAPDGPARGRLLYSVVLFAMAVQTAILLVVIAIAPTIASWLMDSERWSYLPVLAYLVAGIGFLKTFFLITLRNEGRAHEYVRYSVDEMFLGVVLSLAAVVVLRVGVAGLLVGPLVASTLVFLALAHRFARHMELRVDGEQLRDTLRVSVPLAPRILINAVGNQLDRLVLGALGSLADVGVYTIGQRMAQLVFGFMTALQNVYQPAVYRMLFSNAAPRSIGSFLLPFGYASVAVALAAIVFSKEIVFLAAAPEFAGAAAVLAILAVHYGFTFFGKQPQLVFAKRTAIASMLSALTVALTALAIYLGAKTGGIYGVAIGTLVAGIVTGGIGFAAATRFAPIAYPIRPTLILFGSLPLALALTLWIDGRAPYSMVLGIKIVSFGVFLALGWKAGLIGAVWQGKNDLTSVLDTANSS